MTETPLPDTLTSDEAFRAAFFMADQYVALEHSPDEGLILFLEYLKSDPARWDDWRDAIRQAVTHDASTDLLVENLRRT